MALLFEHDLVTPDLDGTDGLKATIELTSDPGFRDKRQSFYEWQGKMLALGVPPATAVSEMRELVEGYNRCVEKATKRVQRKFAFTIGAIAIQLVGAVLSANPLPAASALLQFVAFKALDGKPIVAPGACQPAAMFHDAQRLFH